MITPISKNNDINKPFITFKAHPDFEKLAKRYEITASSFFRRGQFYGSTCDEFVEVANTLNKIFLPFNKSKSMLIAGIGDSQEPFSYLAVIKALLRDTPLGKVVDLYTVDMQSKPTTQKLRADSFFHSSCEPEFARCSFVKDDPKLYGAYTYQKWRVLNEIFEYLNAVYNNVKRSVWDTRIQDAIKKYPDEIFDVVSINNTLGYIESPNEIVSTCEHVKRTLKPNGIFITDPYKLKAVEESGVLDNMTELYNGIYQKK